MLNALFSLGLLPITLSAANEFAPPASRTDLRVTSAARATWNSSDPQGHLMSRQALTG
jgi:hypothetical protein